MGALNKKQFIIFAIYFFSYSFLTAIQVANASSVLSFLNAPVNLLAILWLAGPIAGLIFGMLFGQLSDITYTRFGKRKPYLLICGILVVISLIWFPLSNNFLEAGISLWLYYICFNGCMWPLQAWVGDLVHPSQLSFIYSLQMFMSGLGASLGSLIGLLGSYVNKQKFSFHSESVPSFLILAFLTGALVFLIATLLASIGIPDKAPKIGSSKKRNMKKNITSFFKGIQDSILHPPKFIRKIFFTQLFIWYAIYAMWVYFPLAIAQHFYGLPPIENMQNISQAQSHLVEQATQLAGINYAIAQFAGLIFSFFIPTLLQRIQECQLLCFLVIIGAIALSMNMIFDSQWVMVITMLVAGTAILGPGALMLPVLALNKESSSDKRGLSLGVFNLTVTLPQILSGLTVGFIHEKIFHNNAVHTLLAASILILIGGLFSLRFFKKE